MPNYVRCRLKVSGDQETIDKMVESIRSTSADGNVINFNLDKIIPMPEELNIDSGSSTEDGMLYLYAKGGMLTHFDEYENVRLDLMEKWKKESPEHFRKCVSLGLAAYNNIARFGYPTWYEWCKANWGTKWNTGDNAYNHANHEYEFTTAWSAPVPCIYKLSERYPDLTFDLKYADENAGHNCGMMTFSNGTASDIYEPEGGSREAYELSFELWPDWKENFRLVNGNYKCIEEDEDFVKEHRSYDRQGTPLL